MSKLAISQKLHRAGTWNGFSETCALSYDARFFRRKKLSVEAGWSFVADFEKTVSLNHGDALELPGGQLVAIEAAPEELLAVSGDDLARLAWHIGNRHTPCQIERDRLLIQREAVIEKMLMQLGATIEHVTERFTPEGGAYGVGRTHSHSHGHGHKDHAHER